MFQGCVCRNWTDQRNHLKHHHIQTSAKHSSIIVSHSQCVCPAEKEDIFWGPVSRPPHPNKWLSVGLNLIYVTKMDLVLTSFCLFVSLNHPTLHTLSVGCLIFSYIFLLTQVNINYVRSDDKLIDSIFRTSSVSRNWGGDSSSLSLTTCS